MGILQALRLTRNAKPDARAATETYPSPLSDVGSLDPNIAAAFGISVDSESVTRREAMSIPAVRRGRSIIAGTLAGLPLSAHRESADGQVEAVERALLDRPDPQTTRVHFLTWLFDDLLFYGLAWLMVTGRDAQGYPSALARVAHERVRVDPERLAVYVDGRLVADRDLVRVDGPDEGILIHGARTLRTSLLLEQAVRRFARLDVPLGYLRPEEGATELSQPQIDALLDDWESARETRTTAYLNRAVSYNTVQFDAQRVQLAEARSHQAAECARLMSLEADDLNAPAASGMTYSNVESRRRQRLDSLAPYLDAVEQRLSMPDVTPRRQTVRFDVTRALRGDTLTTLQAAQLGVDLGVLTRREVRTDWLGRPPLDPADEPEPATDDQEDPE